MLVPLRRPMMRLLRMRRAGRGCPGALLHRLLLGLLRLLRLGLCLACWPFPWALLVAPLRRLRLWLAHGLLVRRSSRNCRP